MPFQQRYDLELAERLSLTHNGRDYYIRRYQYHACQVSTVNNEDDSCTGLPYRLPVPGALGQEGGRPPDQRRRATTHGLQPLLPPGGRGAYEGWTAQGKGLSLSCFSLI